MRKWLNKNKIFFEVAMTLAVVFIAIQANNISQAQIEIEKTNLQPHFSIREMKDNKLEIVHTEGKYENLKITTISKLNFSFNDGSNLYLKYGFLADNYSSYRLSNLSDEIHLNMVTESDSIYQSFKNKFKQYISNNFNDKNPEFYMRTYIELTYNDFEGNFRNKYYDITDHPFQIPYQRGDRLFTEMHLRLFYIKDQEREHFNYISQSINIVPEN